MLSPTTLSFLSQLKENNNKEWFEDHRKDYLQAKEEFLDLVENIITSLSKYDKGLEKVQAKDCLFRINRDVRFSNDKRPYKNHFGAAISARGRKSSYPCYYLHAEPQNSFVAGGSWMPEKEILFKIRQEISYNYKDFLEIINSKGFKKYFKSPDTENKLKSSPKGFEKEDPAIEYLKLQSFTISHALPEGFWEKEKPEDLILIFREMIPFNAFIGLAYE